MLIEKEAVSPFVQPHKCNTFQTLEV